jgi:hypothetical protein
LRLPLIELSSKILVEVVARSITNNNNITNLATHD